MIDESAGASEHASIRRTAERHAVIAASVCATLGVVSGFAIYLIFARLLVQEETGRGLTGLIVGLAVAAAFTALIDWVREVIHKGEAVFGWPSWRALPQALLIILAFELTITALHEAAKDTIVELRTIQNIGAKIAGKKISGLGPNRNERDLTNLYRQLQDDIQQYGFVNVPISEGPSSVAARLTQFFSPLEMAVIVAGPHATETLNGKPIFSDAAVTHLQKWMRDDALYRGTPDEVPKDKLAKLFFDGQGWQPWMVACANRSIANGGLDGCRIALAGLSERERKLELWRAMFHVILEKRLYDPTSFRHVELETTLRKDLADLACSAAKGDAHNAPNWCGEITAKHAASYRSDVEVAMLNHELLASAHLPTFDKLPSFWGDFWFLFALWCCAAIILARVLVYAVFHLAEFKDWQTAIATRLAIGAGGAVAAGLTAGLGVFVMAFVPYVWDLLFHTCRAVTGSDASFDVVWLVTTAIPKLIETAGRCHADGAWVFLPGWATLPIIAAGFLWGRRRLLDLADASTRRWASPLSWVVLPFMLAGPVLNKGMGELTVVVAATWMVPAVGLACLLPILRPSSEMPIYWAGVAFAGAALIASWALFSFGELDWSRMVLAAVAVCIVIAIGFLIDRKVAVTDMWPLLALTICMGAIGIAQPLQSLTFDHALKTIHILSNNASSELPPLLEFYSPEARARQPVRDPKSYYPEYAKPEPIKEVASPQAIRMELALVGAMSFWLTLAILAAWRLADQTNVRKHDTTPIE